MQQHVATPLTVHFLALSTEAAEELFLSDILGKAEETLL